MIPLIERAVVTKNKWLNTKDITDIFAIAESVPGAIAINTATFIGFRVAGVRGALAAMLGVTIPTFLIIITLSILYIYFKHSNLLEVAFEGIRPAIVALILYTGLLIGKTAVIDKTTFVTVCITIIVLFTFHIHPVLIILSGIILGIGIQTLKTKNINAEE